MSDNKLIKILISDLNLNPRPAVGLSSGAVPAAGGVYATNNPALGEASEVRLTLGAEPGWRS